MMKLWMCPIYAQLVTALWKAATQDTRACLVVR